MSVVYRITLSESGRLGYLHETSTVPPGRVSEELGRMLSGRPGLPPEIAIERVERMLMSVYDINERPIKPAILVLDPWGTYPSMQINKISAIKALREVDPGRLGLKDAKDLVEQGGEIFCPWDLTARVALFLREGLRQHQLYAEVCAQEDEAGPISGYSPAFDAESDPERRCY